MNRRLVLKYGGMALWAAGLAACGRDANGPGRGPLRLPPVRVSWDRVIRTTVGLRPHRPSGFVLRAEKWDAKTIVHNYGHGGAGMSLSWGTARMAADLARDHPSRRAAVLGCGVVGLTTARTLQRYGFDVTIYAAAVPPDTTSNMSLARFTPASGLVAFDRRTAAWDDQFRRAAELAYRELQLLAGSRYGVSWITNYWLGDDAGAGAGPETLLPDAVRRGTVVFAEGQHPFPVRYAVERPELRIEPSIYLDALVGDVLAHGGRIAVRRFDTPRSVMALEERVIVNCTGLGAKCLTGDPELVPVKGQLTALVPQAEVGYSTSGGTRHAAPGVFAHMMPRRDGIILGGTSEHDVWTSDVNDAERLRVVEGHRALFDAMPGSGAGAEAGPRLASWLIRGERAARLGRHIS